MSFMAERSQLTIVVGGLAVLTACSPGGVAPDSARFDEVARRALDRARTAERLADGFDQRAALDAIGESPYDVRSLRFIDLSDRATHLSPETSTAGMAPADRHVMRWTFEADQGRLVGIDDQLLLDLEPTSPATVGALRLRAVAPEGESVRLRAELVGQQTTAAIVVRLDLAADGVAHDYTIDLRAALDRREGAPIGGLVIRWESGAEARIESIDLLGRTWRFEDRWGVGSERAAGETRPVVYLSSPGSLSWELEGSWNDARLSFALAEAVPGQTTRVRLDLAGPGRARRLAEFDLAGGEAWRDHEIVLGEVDLDGAQLVLSVGDSAGSPTGSGVVLWAAPVLWEPPARRFNVLVLLEDALRADRMSIYGHQRETTPFKTELFADGVRFERCIAQATKTRFSCPSMLSSLRPFATGVWGIWNRNPRLGKGYVTLAEVLASRGWATASFLQNGNAGPDNGLDQGFERVVENLPGRADGVYGGEALEWIRRVGERNFFGYLHVADPHAPYDPPEPLRRWHDQIMTESGGPRWSDPVWLTGVRRSLYDGEVASNDVELPALIDRLEAEGILDDTLLILVADHGEHLGEHDLWDHIPPSYLQVIRVPLLMRYPNRIDQAKVIRQPVQNIDLMPTILDLAGIDTSKLPLHGRSLVPLMEGNENTIPGEVAVVQEAMLYRRASDPRIHASLIWDSWHYLRSPRVGQVLFDHVGDPDEDHPQTPSYDFDRRALALLSELRRLDEVLHGHLRGGSSEEVEVDLDTIHNLEALGYLDD
jgi:arylsulfatase A-like enzyme